MITVLQKKLPNFMRTLFFIVFLNVVAKFIGFFGSVWLTRKLGPIELGKAAVILSLVDPIQRVSTLGLDPIVVRRAAKIGQEKSKALFWSLQRKRFKFSIFLSMVWVICFLIFLFQTRNLEYFNNALIVIPMIALLGINFFSAAQYYDRLPQYNINAIIGSSASTLLILIFITDSSTAGNALAISTAAFIAAAVYSLYFGARLLGRRSFKDNIAEKISFKEGIWPLLVAIASYAYTIIGIPIVAAVYGEKAAGLYKAASVVPNALILLVVSTVGQILYPKYVSLLKDRSKLYYFLTKLNRTFILLIIISTVALFFLKDLIIYFLYGNKYNGAGLIFWVLSIAKIVILWVNIWSLSIIALGGEKKVAIITIFVAILSVTVNLTLNGFFATPLFVASVNVLSELAVGIGCWICVRNMIFKNIDFGKGMN